jgi:hypothetical protein
MATTFLTPEEPHQYDAVPDEISRREVVQYFALTPDDLAEVNRCRRSALCFGFALQVCYLQRAKYRLSSCSSTVQMVICWEDGTTRWRHGSFLIRNIFTIE